MNKGGCYVEQKSKRSRAIHSLLASALIAGMLGGLAQPALAVEPDVAEPEEIAVPVDPDSSNTEPIAPKDAQGETTLVGAPEVTEMTVAKETAKDS